MNLEKVELHARLCAICRKMCRHVCTTHAVTRNEADTPNERALVAFRAMQRGEFLPSEVDQMYEKCATCGACLASCAPDLDAGAVMLHARADIVEQGLAPATALEVNRNVATEGNPFGLPRAERFAALQERIAALPDKADVLYFMGCSTLYRQPEIALAAFDVLEAAGVDFTVIKNQEICCGEPQYLLGFWDDAATSARTVVDLIARSGASRVVYTCPSCVRVMKDEYSNWGIELPAGVELIHMSQYLVDLLDQGKLKLDGQVMRRVAYHDPCDLGRKMGIYEEPRSIISTISGVELKKMAFEQEDAKCCGAGGGLNATNLPISIKASRSVTELALDAEANTLVTACPTCKFNFKRHESRYEDFAVLDLVELAAMALKR